VEKGEGPHIITGPIEIAGSEPGDLLAIHIKNVKISVPFGFNMNRYGQGLLFEDFPYEAMRIIRMNLQNMTSEILPGVVMPLKPFFGTLGVAPPSMLGRISSSPPGVYGENIDNKELASGSIIYLLIQIRGPTFLLEMIMPSKLTER
jgi:acetamidase/formamidase